ncbi:MULTISPECIES: helix-turn-helix transcriptional regulator [unclassified Flavobacterium]|uniref:helix-turn-helix transcriptional regulator n=1 Tax=unclassified Flavobacterium TaxID=196869 RepID=UPI0012AA2EA9|nr:helix-turn-helix transcriptional regulator [Flavobacterium sp. SLB02]MBF4484250.1 helix-turn-helix transcriptional regulator [Flavobacterium sp. CSZ]QGK74764.1 helix-turn-helix domain-containing protein [Flavobacterium sp. SLB02]
MSTAIKPKYIGRNISCIRELKDMKQEALVYALGISQQTISTIENSENVDEQRLIEIAKVLEVSVETIKNFSEEVVFNIIGNTFQDHSSITSGDYNCNCTFNPLDKVVELYERLVQAEKDKVEYLEKLFNGK